MPQDKHHPTAADPVAHADAEHPASTPHTDSDSDAPGSHESHASQAAEDSLSNAAKNVFEAEAKAKGFTHSFKEASKPEAIKELEDKLAKAKDQVLRAQAEGENIRRRARIDLEKAHKYGQEKFALELLPVLDSLEKGIQTAQENLAQTQGEGIQAIYEGMELTHKMLLSALEKFGIQPESPLNHPFNPTQHEALSLQENDQVPNNTVVEVIQTGYTHYDRVLRHALVIVSKGGPKSLEKS